MEKRALTPQEKKQYLLAKYTKRDYNVNELKPKYAVYFNPAIDKIKDWTLICVCETLDQAKHEILFRKKYIETGDGDLVVENDPRFSTWKNELLNVDKNGNPARREKNDTDREGCVEWVQYEMLILLLQPKRSGKNQSH